MELAANRINQLYDNRGNIGIITALYPSFSASITSTTTPGQHAKSTETFHIWRDLGYAFGALSSGLFANAFGVNYAIGIIDIPTNASALIIQLRIPFR